MNVWSYREDVHDVIQLNVSCRQLG